MVSEESNFLESDFFNSAYEDDDKAFLRDFLAKHHDIKQKFDAYVAMSTDQRLAQAHKDLALVTRAAWDDIRVPGERQSVAGHVEGMLALASDFSFGQDPELREMIKLHDLCEAIVGDIANHLDPDKGKINRADKTRIEMLASKLLFEDHPREFMIFMEYENKKSVNAKRVKAIDLLEFIQQSLQVEEGAMKVYPEKFHEFWLSVSIRLKDTFDGNVPKEIQHRMQQFERQRDTHLITYL